LGLGQIKFRTEAYFYQKLAGYGLTPVLLEVGDNYLKIERYEVSLEDALISRSITNAKYREIYNKIVSLVRQLDQYGIIHNDLSPRNIVCEINFNNLAIIDFESAVGVDSLVSNMDAHFEQFSVEI